MKKPSQRAPQDDAAMKLRRDRKASRHHNALGAGYICKTALRKIRADQEALAHFQNLIEFRRSEKDKRAA